MPQFEFNLIREQIAPPGKRKFQLYALIVYLLVCAIGLIVVFGSATRSFIKANIKANDIKRLELEFKQGHPQHDDIVEYASLLKYNMNLMTDTINTLETTIGSRSNLARIIIGISAPLPVESIITELRLVDRDNKVTFDIAVPMTGSLADIPNAGELVTLWNTDPELMNEVSNLTATASHRKLISGIPHFILKFSGDIAKRTAT